MLARIQSLHIVPKWHFDGQATSSNGAKLPKTTPKCWFHCSKVLRELGNCSKLLQNTFLGALKIAPKRKRGSTTVHWRQHSQSRFYACKADIIIELKRKHGMKNEINEASSMLSLAVFRVQLPQGQAIRWCSNRCSTCCSYLPNQSSE